MKRSLGLILCVLLSIGILGCNDAKQFAAETREGYKMVEEVAGQVSKMVASLDTNDLAQAKEIAVKIEHVLSTRVLSWYFKILAVEETQGNDAARALIAELKKTDNINATETKALNEMDRYFQGKVGRTGDLLFLLCAIAAEHKYGHGGGELFLRLASRYRKFERYPPEAATNAVAASLTNEPPAPIAR
jgi:hypothetical protein